MSENCVGCGHAAGFIRAVVDSQSGAERGRFRVDCDVARLGSLASELGDCGSDTCVCCVRDELWALPLWEPSTYLDANQIRTVVDYDVESAELVLGDEQFHERCEVSIGPLTERGPLPDTTH